MLHGLPSIKIKDLNSLVTCNFDLHWFFKKTNIMTDMPFPRTQRYSLQHLIILKRGDPIETSGEGIFSGLRSNYPIKMNSWKHNRDISTSFGPCTVTWCPICNIQMETTVHANLFVRQNIKFVQGCDNGVQTWDGYQLRETKG